MGVVSNHTPAPWPLPDVQTFAFDAKLGSELKAGLLSLSDYLHARQCVNEAPRLRGAVEVALSTGALEHGGVADILREALAASPPNRSQP